MLLILIAAGGLLTLGLVLAAAIWASRESDAAALDRQRELVDGRLRTQLESVERELGLMAQGFARSLPAQLDQEAPVLMGESFTAIITTVFGYDEAFVVRADGKLAFQINGEAADRYNWIRPLLMPMLDRVASDDPIASEVASGKAVELMRLQGRPSIAGIIPIASTTSAPLFLIAYRYIDGPALDAFSRQQGLNGARFARASDPGPEEVSFQINATASNEPIGFVIWTPDLPGSRVVGRLIPALAGAALIVAVLLASLMLLLQKSLSNLQESERKARHQSMHDVLTGLPNRALFGLRLEQSLDEQRRGITRTVVALIDLDRFKAVNDTLGHGAGDELIQAVAGRISKLLEPQDTLSRLGGDEFALLLPNRAADDLGHLDFCQQIIAELSRPFTLLSGNATASVGCSIGVLTLPNEAHGVSEILHMADLALYQAKSTGRGRWVEYSPAMDQGAKWRDELKADLTLTLDRAERDIGDDGLEVFFQTVHRAGPGDTITGAEALVRWRHPQHGLLAPDQFIPLAEDNGLIHRLGSLVLKRACMAAKGWPNGGFVAVNVSPNQLRRADFAEEVTQILKATSFPHDRLELEVTETALMSGDEALVNKTINALRSYGIKIALDDFGTGYSSLSHLVRFGIDRIKIDRSFVKLLGTRADGAAIVSAVVALSNSLGLATTAEGVETSWQRDFLVAAGCSDLQGFLFSRPVQVPDMGMLSEVVNQ
jgi:diguanylate cyclase (GGDEF)-like protein